MDLGQHTDGIVFTPSVPDVTVYIVTPFCPAGTHHFEHALISGYKVVDSKLTNWTVCTQGPGSHFCARKQSRTGRVRILQGYLKKGYDHVISECPAACTVLGTRCLRNCPGNCPNLVPENQCLGTAGTKWCCVHPLSTWYSNSIHNYTISLSKTRFWIRARTK